jgi:hypothetical protein
MKIHRHKPGSPFGRRIVVNGQSWSWRIAVPNVWIRSPHRDVTITTDAFELHGTTWEQWSDEHGGNEPFPSSIDIPRNPDVTPSLIRQCILNQLPKLHLATPAKFPNKKLNKKTGRRLSQQVEP